MLSSTIDVLPASRSEAKASGTKHYFTGSPCIRGHIAPRFTSIGKCKQCAVEDANAGYTHTTTKRRSYSELEGFIVKANSVHGNTYAYDKAVYTNAHTKLTVSCLIHGDFSVTPTNHTSGKGCPSCAIQRTRAAQIKNTSTFITHAKSVWGEAYDYSLVDYKGAKTSITFVCVKHNKVVTQQPSNHLEGKQACTQCNHMKSAPEEAIAEFLSQYTTVLRNNRTVLKPKEIDIWLPEHNIGIELHGLYYHTVSKVGKSHRDKWELAEKAGVQLVQIFEDEWIHKQEIVKGRLLAFIGHSKTFNARQLNLKKVEMCEIRGLLEATHIQGAGVSSTNYALFDGETPIAVATFGKSRSGAMIATNEDNVWEVIRYASIGRVRGGFSKLFKQFLSDINPEKVVSYCDLRYGTGKLYAATGFTLDSITAPDYWWVPKGKVQRVPRYVTQKHKIAGKNHPLHKYYSADKTENQICAEAGWEKIYGVGNQKWVWVMK